MSPVGDVEGDELAGALGAPAGADCEHLTLLGLLFGGVRDDQARRGGLLGFSGADDDPVLEGLELHDWRASCSSWLRLALERDECQR